MVDLIRVGIEDDKTAYIRLGENYEAFELNLNNWTREQYVLQWKNAAKYAMQKRLTSAFICDYECAKNNIKLIKIYSVIPEEATCPREYLDCDDTENLDFFITESFVFITEDVNKLKLEDSYEQIFSVYDEYFPIYYLNPDHIQYFYLYLSDRIEGVSNWRISKEDLLSVTRIP